jgi:hypothetical protein
MESRKAKRLLKEVRDVLRQDWDPLPGSPADEYDPYAPALVRLLLAHADETRLSEHIRSQAGGALAVPEPQLALVVARLRRLVR